MQVEEGKVSRSKIVGWLGALSLFAAAGSARRRLKSKKPTTVKMLTQDGQLVEVDASLLATKQGKKYPIRNFKIG